MDVWNGSTTQVNNFKAVTGITYPLLLQAGPLQSVYGIVRDYSAVVDQQGILRYKGAGVQANQINSTIMNLLATTDIEPPSQLPESFALEQNYPNPFNPTTRIHFTVPNREQVSIRIFTMEGKYIRTLLNNDMNAGEHELSWNGLNDDGNAVASGLYFYVMAAGDFRETRKMILLR